MPAYKLRGLAVKMLHAFQHPKTEVKKGSNN